MASVMVSGRLSFWVFTGCQKLVFIGRKVLRVPEVGYLQKPTYSPASEGNLECRDSIRFKSLPGCFAYWMGPVARVSFQA